ncbi:MAG: hypothetical protein WA081_15480 [Desulfosalsimonadaceae bacterium]
MDTIILGTLTLKDLIMYAGGLAALFFVWSLAKKFFKKKGPRNHQQMVNCTACGWHGIVSRYAGICPKCNASIGSQKASPRNR